MQKKINVSNTHPLNAVLLRHAQSQPRIIPPFGFNAMPLAAAKSPSAQPPLRSRVLNAFSNLFSRGANL